MMISDFQVHPRPASIFLPWIFKIFGFAHMGDDHLFFPGNIHG